MNDGHELFERDALLWWSDDSHCSLLTGLIPARLEYLRHIAEAIPAMNPANSAALDVGCGGGLFAEELARLGCRVTGIDPSRRSIEIAREHAKAGELPIEYLVAAGEELPFAEEAFDVVLCCDVLEHVRDAGAVIAQSAAALKPGGVFMYDTVNRTLLSKFIMIKLVQDWLRIAPKELHHWESFIRPVEMDSMLEHCGLEPRGRTGLMPKMSPGANLRRLGAFLKLRRGKITYSELAREMVFRRCRPTSLNYMGYAVKS